MGKFKKISEIPKHSLTTDTECCVFFLYKKYISDNTDKKNV